MDVARAPQAFRLMRFYLFIDKGLRVENGAEVMRFSFSLGRQIVTGGSQLQTAADSASVYLLTPHNRVSKHAASNVRPAAAVKYSETVGDDLCL